MARSSSDRDRFGSAGLADKKDDSQSLAGTSGGAIAIAEPGAWPAFVPRIKTFESLRFRDYRLLWLGQGGTSMGQWMDQVARSWLVYRLTGSALQLGTVSAMRAIPMLFFGVIAGVVADRYGRKAQLIISQVTNVILNLILATLVLTGQIRVWHIYVTALLAGTVMAFQQPARQSLISDLVGREYLGNAVALNSAIFNLTRSLGPAVAGATIALIGVDGSYYAQAVLYAWATLWTIQMRVPGEEGLLEMIRPKRIIGSSAEQAGDSTMPAGEVESRLARPARSSSHSDDSFFGSLKEGFQYLLENHLIMSLMFLGLAPVLLGMPFSSLMPVFALDILNVGSVGQGFLLASVGVGALIGALGIASIGSFRRKGMLLLGGATMFGVSLIAFAQSTWMPLSLFCLFIAGVSNTSYTSQDQTIIQTLAPANLRGRVLSIYMLNRGLMPLGSLLAGALADWLGAPWAVTIMGASCAMVALGVAFRTPQIRELEI